MCSSDPAVCDWAKQPTVIAYLRGGLPRGAKFWREDDGFYVDPPALPDGGVIGVPPSQLSPQDLAYIRSEERRVGKECRSRWSA